MGLVRWHVPHCPRMQVWDGGEFDVPCWCGPDTPPDGDGMDPPTGNEDEPELYGEDNDGGGIHV